MLYGDSGYIVPYAPPENGNSAAGRKQETVRDTRIYKDATPQATRRWFQRTCITNIMETTGNVSSPTTHQPLCPTTNRDQRAHKQRMARLRRRRHTLIRKVDEFHTLCGADLYMVIRMNGRFYEYSSTKQPSWPPQRAEIVSCHRQWREGFTDS